MCSKTLKGFREGEIQVLVSSDAMTRGMDVEGVRNVINYDMPVYIKTYIHRAGRTARAGQAGRCFTLLPKDEVFVSLSLILLYNIFLSGHLGPIYLMCNIIIIFFKEMNFTCFCFCFCFKLCFRSSISRNCCRKRIIPLALFILFLQALLNQCTQYTHLVISYAYLFNVFG